MDYTQLDKSSKSSEKYLSNRSKELDSAIASIRSMRDAKELENKKLLGEIADLEREVLEKREAVNKEEERLNELDDPNR